jgi:hypothetical protein
MERRMTTASEYRAFAKECLQWAAEAETEADRNSFLELARDWTHAAMHLEGVLIRKEPVTERPVEHTA